MRTIKPLLPKLGNKEFRILGVYMERQYVDSKMISSIGYDASNSTLEVEFSSGIVWQYFDFPESLWYEFESSDSKGSFFHKQIKDQYTGSQI